ncbi:MAG: hypothetical protein AAB358_00280 [Patescibacteria group bacterium]
MKERINFENREAAEFIEDTPEMRASFKVSIFGTGSEKSVHDSVAVSIASELAKKVIRDGQHKIVTGGYEDGVMGAASRSAREEAESLGRNDLLPEGVTLGDKLGNQSQESVITEKETLPERLKDLIDEASAVVVLHGKIGTVVELLTTLWSSAIEKIKKQEDKKFIPKPLIIADSSLEHTDLVAFLRRRDSKIENAIKDVYFVSLSNHEGNRDIADAVNTINRIIENYYKMKLGRDISNDDKQLLDKLSLGKFLESQQNFESGSGI